MEWDIEYSPRDDRVVSRVRGEIVCDDADRMLSDLAAKAKACGTGRVLVDDRLATLAFSIVELHARPAHYTDAGFSPSTRMAVLFEDWNIDEIYLETRVARCPFPCQIFVDYDAAVHWLNADERPPLYAVTAEMGAM